MEENENLEQDLNAMAGIKSVNDALNKAQVQIDAAIKMTSSEHATLIKNLIVKTCYQEQIIKHQKDKLAQKDRIIKNQSKTS